MHCLNCGKKNDGGAGPCAQCGAPVPKAEAQPIAPTAHVQPGQAQPKRRTQLIIIAAIAAAVAITVTVILLSTGGGGMNGLYYSIVWPSGNQDDYSDFGEFYIMGITFTDGHYILGYIQPANGPIEPFVSDTGTYALDDWGDIRLYSSRTDGGSFAISYDSSRNVVIIAGQEFRKW